MTYPLGDMSLNLLKKIVDQLPPETTIVPFFRGESAFHPHFVDAFKMLSRFDTVQMATNGDFLTTSKQDAILDTCSFISYSLHKPSYPEIFVDVVYFLDYARRMGLSTQVSVLETEIPVGTKQRLIDDWLKHVDRFRIYVEHSKEGFGSVESRYRRIHGDRPCHKPFSDMVVYWDGKVVLCNHDWDNYEPLGDLNIQTIEEVWNGERYEGVRNLHKAGLLKKIKTCKDCDYWMTDYLPSKMFGEVYTND